MRIAREGTSGAMQAAPNGIHTPVAGPSSNGHDRTLVLGLDGAPSQEELENELPDVEEGQVPLGELLSRVAQAIYSELTEMADTFVYKKHLLIFATSLTVRNAGYQTCRTRRANGPSQTGL